MHFIQSDRIRFRVFIAEFPWPSMSFDFLQFICLNSLIFNCFTFKKLSCDREEVHSLPFRWMDVDSFVDPSSPFKSGPPSLRFRATLLLLLWVLLLLFLLLLLLLLLLQAEGRLDPPKHASKVPGDFP